jgi:putative endonuclease
VPNLSKKKKWYVYILKCKNGSFYTGMTCDLARRFNEHKNKRGGRFTRSFGVEALLYSEKQPSRSLALKREYQIKTWPRKRKLALAMGI